MMGHESKNFDLKEWVGFHSLEIETNRLEEYHERKMFLRSKFFFDELQSMTH